MPELENKLINFIMFTLFLANKAQDGKTIQGNEKRSKKWWKDDLQNFSKSEIKKDLKSWMNYLSTSMFSRHADRHISWRSILLHNSTSPKNHTCTSTNYLFRRIIQCSLGINLGRNHLSHTNYLSVSMF